LLTLLVKYVQSLPIIYLDKNQLIIISNESFELQNMAVNFISKKKKKRI
jgi:hypothetical protein